MHILILGAGAMGSLLGARLSRTEASVTLFSTNREHIQAIQAHGLSILELDGSEQHYHLAACDHPHKIQEEVDLVIVLVKSYATEEAVGSILGSCHTGTLFLTLQNGIGNWEHIAGVVGTESVLLGTTAQGVTRLGPGKIRHGGNGATFIGEPREPASHRVQCIVDVFRNAGLEAHPSDTMQQLIWEKLMINVGINAITALAGIRNGKIVEVEEARELSRAAVEEAVTVAQARGFKMPGNMVERMIKVAQATAVNRSSMGQDVDRKKRTEIDAINGAVVHFARQDQVPVPVNKTLTQLIKILEAGYAKGD
ncbi:ketopantoate reductase family protein [Desulforhabdus sp. TSK]|uniref:ketopantoate reductase family protein n=1 Tax=Desulforhabdus sp. TSK TaxID=2925014 RepID=UPI001FC8427F|nr:2-dehydropantoate 2-reductase [Desulforhabdus sp. TSK]GKT09931.1 2-dehydropantoate 2-reductase [Desulforhabdus sp. TSK]